MLGHVTVRSRDLKGLASRRDWDEWPIEEPLKLFVYPCIKRKIMFASVLESQAFPSGAWYVVICPLLSKTSTNYHQSSNLTGVVFFGPRNSLNIISQTDLWLRSTVSVPIQGNNSWSCRIPAARAGDGDRGDVGPTIARLRDSVDGHDLLLDTICINYKQWRPSRNYNATDVFQEGSVTLLASKFPSAVVA
ncbi:hypothetical protein BJX63DRAFT_406189 [Aspergillus granulosus]|uniref:Heterokaryon incompatibility domain-containing protein n=1 Tax=Aspergillus granulosus TaxID=176169 RepID=A0ABR4H206_9EURO